MEVDGRVSVAEPWGKCPMYILDEKLGGPQTRSGHGAEVEFLPMSGIESRSTGGLASGLVTISAELSRLPETVHFHPNS
jgi:hypothetical protein